jgi:hypothetical protein
MKLRTLCFLLFPVLLLMGCGYHFGESSFAKSYHTISVPLVIGDEDGDLTAVLVEQIVQSGVYQYCRDNAALILQVELLDFDDENIGFRYDRKKDGKRRKAIIPTETRLFVEAEISLIETNSGKCLLGPVRLVASVDFDHDYYSDRREINRFSLGQLNDYDTAYDAAYKPLNRVLAQKIVDLINDCW